jgi:hypothetical protein
MSRPARAAAAVVAGLAVIAGLVAGGIFYTGWQVHRSQQQWCDTLALLTSQPVQRPADPAANPSREQAYRYYADFVTLRDRFGC